ncbi:MAG: translation initiation factor IF-2 [Deltaproteobacteria bacterium]|nr:translation initiation factor IF-2 [Deltaproteobacteria bacterium]
MSKVRVHQLAKQLEIEPKDLIAQLEKIRVRGKKPQSSLEESEVEAVKAALAAMEKPKVTVGEERVVVDRTITAEDQDMGEVQAHEKVVERRVRANVIRRRRSTVELVTRKPIHPVEREEPEAEAEEAAEAAVEAASAEAAAPETPVTEPTPREAAEVAPSEGAPAEAAPAEIEVEAPAAEQVDAPPAAVDVEDAAEAEAPGAAEVQAETGREAGAEEPASPAPVGELEPEATEAAASGANGAAAPAEEDAEATPGQPTVTGPRILGRIDLSRKATPAPAKSAPTKTAAPATARDGQQPAEAEGQDKAGKGAKGKKRVIRKQEVIELKEREFRSPRGRVLRKKRALPGKEQKKTEITVPAARKRVIRMDEAITVGDMAKDMGIKAGEVIKKLMGLGMMATINQVLDYDTATLVANEFDYQVENVGFDVETALQDQHEVTDPEEAREPRPPVVTIMGHVDHGKTSLLDAIRSTNVTDAEAGGITQHIGAYHVRLDGRGVTFLDTPGHEAFTAMRARGAKVTDIVVLVVAADDGVMPQTIEAVDHARAAEVPIIVAVNKMDRPDADPERVQRGLSDHGLVPEAWGGDTIFVPVSAVTHEGLPGLMEMLLLQADLLELKANPNKLARGAVVEAKLERGRGPVSTVLVQEGTLKVGDPIFAGPHHGKVRAMIDDQGRKVDSATPSIPVEILGLQGVPQAGEGFSALTDEATARQFAEFRETQQREAELAKTSKVSLEEFYDQIKANEVKELRVVVKGDVHGSVEALNEAVTRLSTDEVKIRVIHGSVGGITESDVLLASASNAIVIGFNVRPEPKATNLAMQQGVDVRLYTIIYEVIDDIRSAMEGLLEPVFREEFHARIQVREVFNIRGVGTIAGCAVTDGKIMRSSMIRLLRDQVVVHEGRLASLKRFKDDVREVGTGYECGIALDGYQDVKVGDVIEGFEKIPIARGAARVDGGAQLSADR